MTAILLGPVPTFPQHATAAHLRRLFAASTTPTAAGYDRMTHDAFGKRLLAHTTTISRKVERGTYSFTPYREKLVAKKADEPPRVISVPTVRDRLLLAALKEFLHSQGPAGVARELPSSHIRRLAQHLGQHASASLRVIQLDIDSFFPSVPHQPLLQRVAQMITCPEANRLLAAALSTPTLALGTSRTDRRAAAIPTGIPQGLPISNYLAHAYLLDLDVVLRATTLFYTRFVDDILMIVNENDVDATLRLVGSELAALGLRLKSNKTSVSAVNEAFDFLGYTFRWPTVSVKTVNQQRFLSSVARLFVTYRRRRRQGAFPKWLRPKARRAAFIHDLNDRITGAISGRRRYGWLFYFSEMNDLALLRQMDRVIAGYFRRLRDFGGSAPPELKRLVRARFESLYSPSAGYIFDYGAIGSRQGKVRYLVSRGELSSVAAKNLSGQQIDDRFAVARQRRLAGLEQDVSFIY